MLGKACRGHTRAGERSNSGAAVIEVMRLWSWAKARRARVQKILAGGTKAGRWRGKPAGTPCEPLDGDAVFGLDQAAWVVLGGHVTEMDVARQEPKRGMPPPMSTGTRVMMGGAKDGDIKSAVRRERQKMAT